MSQRYRVVCKFEKSETTYYGATKKEVFDAAEAFIDTFTVAENRTGNLLSYGSVYLWAAGEKVGSVMVEEYLDGQYQQYGG